MKDIKKTIKELANDIWGNKKCFCQCHALDNFGWDKKVLSCRHCRAI